MNTVTNTLNDTLPNFLNGAALAYAFGRVISRYYPIPNLALFCLANGIVQASTTKEPFAFLPKKMDNVKITPWHVVAELTSTYVVATFASFIPWSLNPVAFSASFMLGCRYLMLRRNNDKTKTKEEETTRLFENFNVLTVAVSIGILAYPIIMNTAPSAVLYPVLTLARGVGAFLAGSIINGLTVKKRREERLS